MSSNDEPERLWRAIEYTNKSIGDRLDAGDLRMQSIEQSIAQNTQLTQEIRDLLEVGKVLFKLARWIGVAVSLAGKAAAIGAAIYTAFYMLTHHGQGPK